MSNEGQTHRVDGGPLRARRFVTWITLCAAVASIGTTHCTAGAPLPPAVSGVSFEQRIGERLPGDVALRDESGAAVRFEDLLRGKPAVLIFGYARCPQLCTIVANGALEVLRALEATAGRDFSVLYVSIDPTDTTRDLAAMKRRDVGRYGRSGAAAGWHYLTGYPADLKRLTSAAGFHYTYDERQKLYAHASGFLVLTPDGRIARYFLGVDFDPKALAKSLERASDGKTGQSVFQLLLVCARGAGVTGKYGRVIWLTLEIAVSVTVLIVFGGIGWMLRQERGRRFGIVGGVPSLRDRGVAKIPRGEGTPPTSHNAEVRP